MADSPLIAVCGTEEGRTDRIASTLMRRGSWRVQVLQSAEQVSRDSFRPAAACVLVTDGDGGDRSFIDRVRTHVEGSLPLISVGSRPLEEGLATCWVDWAHAEQVLPLLLPTFVRSPEVEREPLRWRRKSDMIIGHSPPVRELLEMLGRLARSSASVLVTGESGTGKELVARALHYCGPRASQGAFVAVNCAAIPENLFEAELFGYEKGAFTGAVVGKPGLFEAADQGTLFLDEIGDMPISVQAKLLRVLETSTVTRIGSTKPRTFNVRIVAATARSLREAMDEGQFRSDLFFRVSVYPVQLPPLRERKSDIPAIVAHHLNEVAARDGVTPTAIKPDALERLMAYHWPGNVRELINVLERAMLFADSDGVGAEHIVLPEPPSSASTIPAEIPPYRDAKREFERAYYGQLLRVAGGNISRAAKIAQKTRKEIYQAIRRLGLEPPRRPSARRSTSPEASDT